jgi:hypothetical protein
MLKLAFLNAFQLQLLSAMEAKTELAGFKHPMLYILIEL